MISIWMSATVMLIAVVANGEKNDDDTQPCATVQTPSSVVPLGSPVRATCVIRDDCPLVTGQPVHIEWNLGNHLIPSSSGANESDRVSQVVIPSFNHTRASLTCCVQASPIQVVGGVEIRAGYPPTAPQNLSCQTNLTTNTLTCNWDPGQKETHLPTKYTLHTEIWDSNEKHTYELPQGVHRYSIPRAHFVFFSEMEVCVKAVNELGEATSARLTLEPLSAGKFDQPQILKIQAVPKKYGCLKLIWGLAQHQTWIRGFHFSLEVRLKTADRDQWSQQPTLVNNARSTKPVDQCRLLHGTWYLAQIRVKYQQSPWSEWSKSQSAVTLEKAPSGRLDSWMRVSGDDMHKQVNIHLFWKPSQQFRANGQNVSYIVSSHKGTGENGQLCFTTENYCTFQLLGRANKVFLRAVNAAGKSHPTEVLIHKHRARRAISDITATPHDDTSLLVQWKSLESPGLTGYVVEWRPLLETDLSFIRFEVAKKNLLSLVITGSFEPYKPYGISVYPRFKDGIGLPQTVSAYSRQKAPSVVPKIRVKKTWQSHIELTWDEIPLEQRNGIIHNCKVFYWDDKGPVNMVNADPEDRRVVLRNLNSISVYEAFLMVSTYSGSRNGSTVHFKIEPIDAVVVVMIITASGVGLSLMIIFTVMTCFSNNRWLKMHFWPAVPDPANSSIKRWHSESTQDIGFFRDIQEPNPVHLSHLSFLDVPTKLNKEDAWVNSTEDTSDLGESLCGSPSIPGYSGSNSDSVPYATVIFSSPCTNAQQPKESRSYLRSESTQPLLELEESFSPKSYRNVASDGTQMEQCFFGPCQNDEHEDSVTDPVIQWDDFPFLKALALNDTENDLEIIS